MQSRQGIGRASSAGSSPRKSRKNASREASMLAPPPIPARDEPSPLQSAWIRRIIPVPRVSPPLEGNYRPEFWTKNINDDEEWQRDGVLFPVAMPCSDDEVDCHTEVSGFKFHTPSSWLTVRNSEEMEGSGHFTTGSRDEKSPPYESKVVPMIGDEMVVTSTMEKFRMDQQQQFGSPGSRIPRKIFSNDEQRCFPPLKSGEQWPGTMKPSGLPPLRIPSTKSPGKLEQSLPLLTPVAAPPGGTILEKDAPSLIRTISLFDSMEASGSSFTCSLPPNLVKDSNTSDRTKSLPEKFGFIDRSLRKDFSESDEEVESHSLHREVENPDIGGRASLESSERSPFGTPQQQQFKQNLQESSLKRSPHRETSPGIPPSSRSERGVGQRQTTQQQWLHRWASSSAHKNGSPTT